MPPRPQCVRAVGGEQVGTPRTPAASASARISRDPTPSPAGSYAAATARVRVEPRTFRRPRDLRVGRDVLALAEERVVQRVLERAQARRGRPPRGTPRAAASSAAESAGGGSRSPPRARAGRRCSVQSVRRWSPRGCEQRPRCRPQLERQPLAPRPRRRPRPPRRRASRGTSTGRRRRSRSGSAPWRDGVCSIRCHPTSRPSASTPIRTSPSGSRRASASAISLLVSGQAAIDEHGGLVGVGDFDAQAEQIFRNLQRVLEAGGSSLDRIVKVTIFLTDMANFPKIVELRGSGSRRRTRRTRSSR